MNEIEKDKCKKQKNRLRNERFKTNKINWKVQ